MLTLTAFLRPLTFAGRNNKRPGRGTQHPVTKYNFSPTRGMTPLERGDCGFWSTFPHLM
ncbi:hypothetical protein CBM2586_B90290 [Cupriavidus phytorum]|uniref:Uncharacterized protein n=1 Tax=Cupriavidus taiwanensis TaxID=164546 RepID=A0A375CNZ9_9BURK|nr:hypothetical protein CBM2586_B90290 [Cupriavidus taiwanensis]